MVAAHEGGGVRIPDVPRWGGGATPGACHLPLYRGHAGMETAVARSENRGTRHWSNGRTAVSKTANAGSIPAWRASLSTCRGKGLRSRPRRRRLRFAGIAQLAERRTRKAQVAGPNPASGSRGAFPWDAKAKVPEREQAHVEAWNRHGVKQSKAASPRTSIVHVAWVRRFRHGWSCDETGVPRSVAQSGGASGWGPEGRGSESRHSDPTPGTHKRST